MFSGWGIAKSAEEMVSRWAVKRICKFFLKKKLGQFILGDIDIDQLDVQLTNGSIQLYDLALNVDFLNQKFGAVTPVIIREGSIGSLLVKMPWKGKGCQVEVDQLEIVLAPRRDNDSRAGDETCSGNQEGNNDRQSDSGQFGNGMTDNAAKPTSNDVHEGVKMIAKMVKWFLTSFHIRIKKLIVAFDPCIESDENKMGSCGTLVLRILETECGTCLSEDAGSNSDARAESFLGISRLTNFVKFQGAVLELLHMDDVDQQTGSPANATTPIMTWKGGGFSGNVKLSIPWKNGSLDIRKVDADVSIDPIELKIQPSTIKWFLQSWEICKKLDKDQRDGMFYKSSDSLYFNSSSHFQSLPTAASHAVATDKAIPICGSYSTNFTSFDGQESASEAMLPSSHLIMDWVPFPVNNNEKDGIQEVDLGASMDQFFECFDGMRNSQSALGSSGMWNWTCSVFSAITAASSLASGSLHVPSEQQHVQTNLKASFAGISIVFSFNDEDQISGGPCVHYLGAECRDIFLVLQVCPRDMRFDGTVKYIEVADYFHSQTEVSNFNLKNCDKDIDSHTVLIQRLQAEVQGLLPPFSKVFDSDEPTGFQTAEVRFGNQVDVVNIPLLKTSGVTCCQFTVNANESHGTFTGSTSFSLKLPPFVFWVNFQLINMLWDLFKEVESSVGMNNKTNELSSVVVHDIHGSSKRDVNRGSGLTTLSSTETLRGYISIPNARVILCFPFSSGKEIGGYWSWDQFIALDFSSPSTLNKRSVEDHITSSDVNFQRQFSSTPTRSLHLNVGSLDIYLVTSGCKDAGIDSCSTQRPRFSAVNVLSVSNRTGHLSVISMIWQDGPTTGPWIAERAKVLATLEESRSRNKFRGKGYEFASVNAVKNEEDKISQTRREMILSSAFFVHVRVYPIAINLGCSEYSSLRGLLNQMISGLSFLAHDAIDGTEQSSVSQTSILVDCDSVELLIRPEIKESMKSSMQSELPGTWHCLKLNVQNFNLLSVSNIGGIESASFFWLAHGEGTLCGSVTGVPNQEFHLISCNNATMKRGDGGGSNVLSSRLAGSDIVHLFEPETFCDFTSVTVRCSTVVAVGGRLDWLDAITSFFSLPSSEIEQAGDSILQREDSAVAHGGASFVLNLVDIGLSYEPYFMNSMVCAEALDSPSGSTEFNEEMGEHYVACLLAASSLILSTKTVANSMDNDYKIRFQDLGLLLCDLSEPEKLGGPYSVECLHESGYVKVAQETLLEAILRINGKNGLLWELECSKSHIYVDTCHDTTSGLISLATQLQQLFAPDIEESIVHLQNRYNNVQQAYERNDSIDESRISNTDLLPSTSQMHNLTADAKSEFEEVGLMNEISEDAFHLDGYQNCQMDSAESQFHPSVDDALVGEACGLAFETPYTFSHYLSVNGSASSGGLESGQTSFLENDEIPEFIEGYYLSDLRSLSELSTGRQSSPELTGRTRNMMDGDIGKGNSGWYGDGCLKIVENHMSETSGDTTVKQSLEGKLSAVNSAGSNDFGKVIGRVLLRNINVTWRMYAGSDWPKYEKKGEHSVDIHGRDTDVCIELALSGMQFQYDLFPTGGMCVSKLSLSVQDFHLYDMSKTAPWKLVLGDYNSKDHPRQSSSKAFKLDLEVVRPNPVTPLEECRLRVAILPMLLHLHQRQLDFLIGFFGTKSSSVGDTPDCHNDSCGSKLLVTKRKSLTGHTIVDEALLPYFQKFDIWPILIRVDYSPSHVDLAALRGGKYVELVNLVPWKGVELQLKHVHAVGIYGWGSVCETIIGEWLEDISQNQIHKLLRGLPTIRSLVSVGSGAAKLVSLPVENYRKDKRVLKGMQRGTIAFLRSISLEAVGLGVHLAAGAHDILLQAEYILTSIPPSVSWPVQEKTKTKTNVRRNQPKDAQQGIQQAYESISDGLGRSASALVRAPLKTYQRGAGAGSALATAVRGVPAAAIAPASACASAVHYALLGLRNSLDPEHKKESMDKYLGPSESRE